MESVPDNLVSVRRHSEKSQIYDFDLNCLDFLKKYDSIECHIIIYPYSREIKSSNIRFLPFEEYSKDLEKNLPSAYIKSEKSFQKYFGAILGLIIFVLFAFLKPSDLFSVQSIVSIFGAYAIGKELWSDIEKWLEKISRGGSLRFQENYYKYELDRHSTLTAYSNLAKQERYKKESILPSGMNFLELSNSQTLRMLFTREDLDTSNQNSVHIFSMHIDRDKINSFQKDGFLFGIKFSFTKDNLIFQKRTEFYQSIHKSVYGCLDSERNWKIDGAFWKKNWIFGHWKWTEKSGLMYGKKIISIEN
ncbi:MAG: hypothetical protein H7A24_00605 [Leptospiraceae bacterium]|nr:hypothetical protein [Leptospiraceae bacterium]MCP5510353.1 hypothetical protein [Leptospiraceae bacterium]